MNYQVEILPQALSDIESAFRWMASNISATTAEQWYEELLLAVESLQTFPNRCPLAPEAQEFQQQIRQMWVGKAKNYRVLFVVQFEQVYILYVRHSSRTVLTPEPGEKE
jgi:plasmid stabilization system protein ParE